MGFEPQHLGSWVECSTNVQKQLSIYQCSFPLATAVSDIMTLLIMTTPITLYRGDITNNEITYN